MGKWAKNMFGRKDFGEIGIVLAGVSSQGIEKKILGFFDKVVSSKDSVYHAHLAEKNRIRYPIVFNIYGAPAMVDALSIMHDGGCRIIIFVGFAYGGFKNLEIGSVVIPNQSYHFEGIYHHIEPDRKAAFPDRDLKKKLEEVFMREGIGYINGVNISVPAVVFQLPHANKEYKMIKPLTLEMELAACYSRAKDIGIRAAGVLIVSDNRRRGLGDTTKERLRLRDSAKIKVLKTVVSNITHFKLPKLPREKEFSIDKYLASVIEDPNDVTNVYRKEK